MDKRDGFIMHMLSPHTISTASQDTTGSSPSFVCMAMPGRPALASTLRQQPPHGLQQAQAVPLDVLVVQGQGMQEGLQVVAPK